MQQNPRCFFLPLFLPSEPSTALEQILSLVSAKSGHGLQVVFLLLLLPQAADVWVVGGKRDRRGFSFAFLLDFIFFSYPLGAGIYPRGNTFVVATSFLFKKYV